MFGKASQTKKASKPNRKVGGPRGKKTGQRRFTTRQLAALDFLRNIPMKNELAIRERGIETAKRANLFDGGDEHDEDGELRRYTAMLQQQRVLTSLLHLYKCTLMYWNYRCLSFSLLLDLCLEHFA